jgi:hypothetical protein
MGYALSQRAGKHARRLDNYTASFTSQNAISKSACRLQVPPDVLGAALLACRHSCRLLVLQRRHLLQDANRPADSGSLIPETLLWLSGPQCALLQHAGDEARPVHQAKQNCDLDITGESSINGAQLRTHLCLCSPLLVLPVRACSLSCRLQLSCVPRQNMREAGQCAQALIEGASSCMVEYMAT